MRVVFRCDASIEIGTGHVMRCLTLAEHLIANGASVAFVGRELDGHICDIIENRKIPCYRLKRPDGQAVGQFQNQYERWLAVPWQEDAEQTAAIIATDPAQIDWLIVDHYGLGREWEITLAANVDATMVIDDLANRPHSCEVLLDQNLQPDADRRYDGLVAESCTRLLGPSYAILRPQFAQVRDTLKERDGSIKRILIFLGGADPSNQTRKAIEAVLSLDGVQADVIVGRSNPNAALISRMCQQSDRLCYHQGVDNIAELMAAADLAIGGAGTTTWERCALGLPSLLISLADNQTEIARYAQESRFALYLGLARDVSSGQIEATVRRLITSPAKVRSMSRRGLEIVDGEGCARVSALLQAKMREPVI